MKTTVSFINTPIVDALIITCLDLGVRWHQKVDAVPDSGRGAHKSCVRAPAGAVATLRVYSESQHCNAQQNGEQSRILSQYQLRKHQQSHENTFKNFTGIKQWMILFIYLPLLKIESEISSIVQTALLENTEQIQKLENTEQAVVIKIN